MLYILFPLTNHPKRSHSVTMDSLKYFICGMSLFIILCRMFNLVCVFSVKTHYMNEGCGYKYVLLCNNILQQKHILVFIFPVLNHVVLSLLGFNESADFWELYHLFFFSTFSPSGAGRLSVSLPSLKWVNELRASNSRESLRLDMLTQGASGIMNLTK